MKTNWTGIVYAHLKYIKQKLTNSKRYRLTKSVINYLKSDDCSLPVEEKSAIKDFLSENFLIAPINYPFVKKYLYRKVKVFLDANNNLHYIYHNHRKLYFKRNLTKTEIINIYNDLCIEQDEKSPHSYNSFNISYHPDDITVEAGAAEGIWSLDIVEKVKAIYLFECDDAWIEALEATFAPWKEKTHIVKKYVSNKSDEENIRLDDYFSGKGIFPTILKADIEGYEIALTEGSSNLLSNHLRHVILCTYHNETDYQNLYAILEQYKFKVSASNGYLIFIHSGNEYYSGDVSRIIRKALIYGRK